MREYTNSKAQSWVPTGKCGVVNRQSHLMSDPSSSNEDSGSNSKEAIMCMSGQAMSKVSKASAEVPSAGHAQNHAADAPELCTNGNEEG